MARVLTDSGEGVGTGPAHVAIEEAIQNVPSGLREADVSTAAGTSCYFRLKAGERYVIITQGPYYSVAICSNSFLLRGNEHILAALQNQANGGPSRLVGTVRKNTGAYSRGEGIENVSVIADSNGARRETFTNGLGHYEFSGLEPGRYQLQIAKAGYVSDSTYNERWSGRMSLNTATNRVEPDKSNPGSVTVRKNSCSIWDLAMWPAGSIQGRIQKIDQTPASGVKVQAFAFDSRNNRENTPLRTAISAADGTYILDSLPSGSYVIGINGRTYDDEDVYPPTWYSGGAKVYLTESGTLEAINIIAPPPRTAAQVRVKVVGPDGNPYRGATIKLENLQGVQRWFSRNKSDANGDIEVPGYVGERYIVRAFDFVSGPEFRSIVHFEGSAALDVSDQEPSVIVALQQIKK